MKKYELLKNDFVEFNGRKLYRTHYIESNTLGGYIEDEKNLSQVGYARVLGNARVFGNARVSDNARVYGDAQVYGEARVFGNAQVFGKARVSGNAQVLGNAWVSDNARVFGRAWVLGKARVSDNAHIHTGYVDFDGDTTLAQVGIGFVGGRAVFYKRVNKVKKGVYASCYDPDFLYHDGKVVKAKNPDLSKAPCSSGIHLSHATYWNNGDTLIACEVNRKDIIVVAEGKIRVKKCKCLGEVK